jgi:hypothetical protein
MNARTFLVTLSAALLSAAPAFAQDEPEQPAEPAAAAEQRLLPESVNLEIVQGSVVPDDCMYPESITNAERFEIACVTMPRMVSGDIGARYFGQLGAQGWHQGRYISGGMTAIRTDENNCERVLNLFPADYPPGDAESSVVVLWLAMDRTPRCPAQNGTP